MGNILEVQGLCKKYKDFALRDVTFAVPRGFIMGFIGQNGAGKTTTIKSILNITNVDSGRIKIFGADNSTDNNGKIGVVMDSPMYVDDWTVADVERAVSPFYSDWNSEKYAKHTKQFGLDRKKKVKDLSRGMKVKLQIAAALSHNAELLILDEPTSGLDPVARDEICDLLREFVADENKSVFFSTHITTDLEKTADFITFILDGRIVFTGAKDDLLGKYARVTGGVNEISGEHKKLIVGYREHSTGFEGMIETGSIRHMPKGVITEEITLDEIVIFMTKEAKINE
ncbi:MAG: ABC transporter ATP-binding protein [Oscillospiraceae bacterium]|nr:ABC transporter ATP-binding protein [Oscillospiraceae bacterium]